MPEARTGWLAGLRHPVVVRALQPLHAQPAQRWTLDTLAVQTGTSRSVLAERFVRHVGQPPMQYLTQWRMQLAARMLTGSGAIKIGAIAESVGCESEAAFSRAFKKSVGTTPGAWRRQGQPAPACGRTTSAPWA